VYYESERKDACEPLDPLDFQVDPDGDITPFFLAWRGSCSFVSKVRAIEELGAAVAIIIDNSAEDISHIIMSDDGSGNGISIPSMLISKKDGEELLDFLKTASDEELNQTALMATFSINSPDNRVEYDIWYSSSNDRALDFITDFEAHDKSLGTDVLMTPHFVFWKCPFCDPNYIKNDCYAGGKYCAVEPSNNLIKGRDIIIEDLREKCLYN
jgi:hypothetical protein